MLFPTLLVERNIFLFSTTLLHFKINKELKTGVIILTMFVRFQGPKKIFHDEGKVPQKLFNTHWKAFSKRGTMEQSAKGC